MTLSEKIVFLRKQHGWSQEELAEHLGVSRQSVSKWESAQSTPELDRIVQLCALFGVTADALIRDDLEPDGSEITPASGSRLSLQESYAYLAECQVAAEKIALGVSACVASPSVLIALSNCVANDILCTAIGLPALFLMVAWAVWLFIHGGAINRRFRRIRHRQFIPDPGVTRWAGDALEQFRPVFVKKLSLGISMCIFSPACIMAFSGLFRLFNMYDDVGISFGVGAMLVMIAAGIYMIVRSSVIRNCYRNLLKEK